MFYKILSVIYPKRCVICDQVLKYKEIHICSGCKNKAEVVTEPVCMHCGKPIEVAEDEYCFDCKGQVFYAEKGFAVWVYDKYMKRSIHNYKYSNRQEYADYYAKETISRFGRQLRDVNAEALIPVPIHKAKLRYRGFNQAELLAEKISERIGRPVFKHLLIRKKNTEPQKGLSNKERRKNLEHAFAVNEKAREDCKRLNSVMLIDDIYTTGATIEACAKELVKAGIKSVTFICLCIGKDF